MQLLLIIIGNACDSILRVSVEPKTAGTFFSVPGVGWQTAFVLEDLSRTPEQETFGQLLSCCTPQLRAGQCQSGMLTSAVFLPALWPLLVNWSVIHIVVVDSYSQFGEMRLKD